MFAKLDDRSAQEWPLRLVKAEVVEAETPDTALYGLGYFRIGGVDEGAHLAASQAAPRLCSSGYCFDQLGVFGDAIRSSGNPAGTHQARGQSVDITGAIAELRQLFTDQQPVLSSGHPLTLTIRAHLTRWKELPAPQDRALSRNPPGPRFNEQNR